MSNSYTGINIQYPISQDILTGRKTIETRTYPLPEKYLNKTMVLIETPGKKGTFKARAIALIKFTQCHKYKNKKEFYEDSDKHLVNQGSIWAWKEKTKYGWKVMVIKKLNPFLDLSDVKKGIVYTNDIEI